MFEPKPQPQRFGREHLRQQKLLDASRNKMWGAPSEQDLIGSHQELGEQIRANLHLQPKEVITEVLTAAAEIPATYFINNVRRLLSSRRFRVAFYQNPENYLFFLEEVLRHAHTVLNKKWLISTQNV